MKEKTLDDLTDAGWSIAMEIAELNKTMTEILELLNNQFAYVPATKKNH